MSTNDTPKSLDDLTETEYQELVNLGAEVQATRTTINLSNDLSFLGVLNDAEYAFIEAFEKYGADLAEMNIELA